MVARKKKKIGNNGKNINKYIIIILALLLPSLPLADELTISSKVDKTRLSMNETVKYTLEVKGDRSVDVPRPNFKNFEIRSGPSQSSQIQIINGEMSAQKNISWWLTPLKTGKVVIPPIKVRYKGKTYSSNQINLNITKQSGSQNRNLLIIKKGGHNDLPQKKIYQKALKRFYDSQSNMQTLKDSLIAPSSVLGLSRK